MRSVWMFVLAIGISSSPVAAATVGGADLGRVGGIGNVANLTMNFFQQWSIPITVNQATAIGINSSDIVAVAETSVISINDARAFTLNFTNSRDSLGTAALPFVTGLLDVLLGEPQGGPTQPSAAPGLSPAAGDTIAPVPVPAALPLAITAFAGLGWIGWRRRANPPIGSAPSTSI